MTSTSIYAVGYEERIESALKHNLIILRDKASVLSTYQITGINAMG